MRILAAAEATLVAIFVGLLATYAGGAVIGATAILHGDALAGTLCVLICLFLLASTWGLLEERQR